MLRSFTFRADKRKKRTLGLARFVIGVGQELIPTNVMLMRKKGNGIAIVAKRCPMR